MHSYTYVLEKLLAEFLAGGGPELRLASVIYIDLENRAHVHRRAPWPRSLQELTAAPSQSLFDALAGLVRSPFPTFSLMHGNEGEDGAWQGLAELLGLSGNFGSVFASALAMNKFAMASLANARTGVRTPRTTLLDWRAEEADLARTADDFSGCAVVVKPNRMGSSLLTERFERLDLSALKACRERFFPYDSELLVQEYVAGQEYTAGCLETDGGITVLPVIHAVTDANFLGHEQKHRAGLVRPEVVTVEDPVAREVSEISRDIFRSFDFIGMCRFDYILADDGVLTFLEANTLPGLSSGSAYSLMLRAGGYGMADLIRTCIAAAERRPKRTKVFRYSVAP